MSSARSRSRSENRFGFKSVLIVGGLALAFTAIPVKITPELAAIEWQTALGMGKGGGGPGGGGPGGNNGRGGGHGGGHAKGPAGLDDETKRPGAPGRDGGHGPQSEYGSWSEFADGVRSGKAFGLERRDQRVEKAKERYDGALSKGQRTGQRGGKDFGVGQMAHRFSPEETSALIGRGWKGPQARAGGFRNHGERVRTMVELAKRLGYGAHVGALQANFGTPQENGIRELETALAEARTGLEANPDDPELQARVADLEAELDAAIRAAKPGNGPDDSWATADLDVNGDGVVDKRDLEALEAQATTGSASSTDPAA